MATTPSDPKKPKGPGIKTTGTKPEPKKVAAAPAITVAPEEKSPDLKFRGSADASPSLTTEGETPSPGPTLTTDDALSPGPTLTTEAEKKRQLELAAGKPAGPPIDLTSAKPEPKEAPKEPKKPETTPTEPEREDWNRKPGEHKIDMSDWLTVFRGLFGGVFDSVDLAVDTGVKSGFGGLKAAAGGTLYTGSFIAKNFVGFFAGAIDTVTRNQYHLREKSDAFFNRGLNFGGGYLKKGLNEATGWGTPIVGLTKLGMGATSLAMGILSALGTGASLFKALALGSEGGRAAAINKAFREGKGGQYLWEGIKTMGKGLDDIALGVPRKLFDKASKAASEGPFPSKSAAPMPAPKAEEPAPSPKTEPKPTPTSEPSPLAERAKSVAKKSQDAKTPGTDVTKSPDQLKDPADRITPAADTATASALAKPLAGTATPPAPAPGAVPTPDFTKPDEKTSDLDKPKGKKLV